MISMVGYLLKQQHCVNSITSCWIGNIWQKN